MNEFYARDSSRKIQAIFKSRMEKGLRCSGSVPYGYRRDPQDKQHLIVDEEAAAVVRRIFQMVIDGKGVQVIARTLTEDKILSVGLMLESVAPEVRGMSQTAFRLLVEQIFSLPEVVALVERMTDQQEGG